MAFASPAAAATPRVLAIHFDADVNPVTQNYLCHQLDRAAKDHYNAAVIVLKTPGGLLESKDKIVLCEVNAKLPVLVWVGPNGSFAGSAGVWIAQAADYLAMAPETNIGSSTPIDSGGQNINNWDLRRKLINHEAASLRALAQSHGRNAQWADRAVREATNATAQEALDMNVIDGIAPTVPALLEKTDGVKTKPRGYTLELAGAKIDNVEPGFFTRLLNTLINPNLLTLLFLAGLAGIGYEIFHPGVVLPGALGLVALITALFGFSVLPVSWAGVILAARGGRAARRGRARHVTRRLNRGGPDRALARRNLPVPECALAVPHVEATRNHDCRRARLRLGVRRREGLAGAPQTGLGCAGADRRRRRRGASRRARVRQRRAVAGAHAGRRAAAARREGSRRVARRARPDGASGTHRIVGMSAALIGIAVLLLLIVLFLFSAIKVAREYERGIVFRLGRLLPNPKGPGLFILIPVVDRMVKVDLRTITLTVPPQEVITKDNVPVRVNAVAYFRIVDPKSAIVQIENYMVATSQIAQTTLRSVLGQHVLDELLSEREKINAILQGIIDESTAPWGIKVSIVEVKDVEIPSSMQRAMARQAEAERERRAKIINSEGEFQAAERLKDAARVIAEEPDRTAAPLSADPARARLVAGNHDRLPRST